MAASKDSHPSATTLSPVGFFALRTPLLPFEELSRFSQGLQAPTAAPGVEREQAVADDSRLLRQRLTEIAARPEVREALYVASPSLVESLPRWLAAPGSEQGQKVERAVVRYFARMGARATPFGLFAGCSVGQLGSETRLELAPRQAYHRHARLDGDYLAALTEKLASEPAVRETLTYQPNSSLARLAGRLHYVKSRMKERARLYDLAAAEGSEELEATLARAVPGASLAQLAAALVCDEVDLAEARAFIDELVDCQLLVPRLVPQVTGPEPIHDLIAQLAAHPTSAPFAGQLAAARTALETLNASPLGEPAERYRAIQGQLENLPEVGAKHLFQVDLVKPMQQAQLGPGPMAEIVRGVKLLARWLPSARGDLPLGRFIEAFNGRYEGREVPLCEALDEEMGVGFERSEGPGAAASPLLDGLIFGRASVEPNRVPWGPPEVLLLRKLEAAMRSGAQEITLSEDEIDEPESGSARPLPDSLAALVIIAAASPAAADAGDFSLHLKMADGPSAANWLGRFCHGDPQLTELVQACLREEEARRPQAVFAEIVHLPQGRTGNVLLRPVLRDHEIVYLGRSGLPRDRQIPVDDLLVSVRKGRVVLRSRTLDREVIPRLTTAHHFRHPANLGIYRFLCHLQKQDCGGRTLAFSWGALDAASFLPRVRSGRLVLALARWRLTADELKGLGRVRGPDRYARVQELRRERGLPRWVAVADGDNQLAVDLDNVLSVETCVELIHRRPQAVLTELFEPERLLASGPEGRFVHEMLVPLRTAPTEAARPRVVALPDGRVAAAAPAPAIARLCPPGSDWLYAKIYCGSATADRLLSNAVAPLLTRLRARKVIDRWFFARYGDPDWHLRLRFQGQPQRLHDQVWPELQAAVGSCLTSGQVWKLQIDSYEREIDRYGGNLGMLLSEELFAADSDACLALQGELGSDQDARWRLTLCGMDMLLTDLGFDLTAKGAILRACRDGFGREFRTAGLLERQMGVRFRQERSALETLLDRNRDARSALEPGLQILRRRSALVAGIGLRLQEAAAAGLLTVPPAELAASYLHMFANRMLRAAARAQELVLYDFLDRLYQSGAARKRLLAPRRAFSDPPADPVRRDARQT
jgi:thiopeptide-type bacteriocin biosynthesis protein